MPISPEHRDLLCTHMERHVRLTSAEREHIARAFSTHSLPRKAMLLEAGDQMEHEHYVVEGCLRTYLLDSEGNEHTLGFAVADWWVGDPRSFSGDKPSFLSIEAIEPCTVLRIDRPAFDTLCDQVPMMDRFFRVIFTRAFSASLDRLYEEHALSVQERLLRCRKRYPWLEQRISQKHIASYLGISPEFLSRNRRKLLGDRS